MRAIFDGLRQEDDKIRVTSICPGVVESRVADTITDESTQAPMREYRRIAPDSDAIARAIAVEQPDDVDVNEIVARPTATVGR